MLDYLQTMFDLALRKELQGLHFWATLYVLVVLLGTVWHVLRVRRWPSTQGQLLRLGVREFAGPALNPADQAYVPDALYAYEVAGRAYQGRELSVWKVSASGILRGAAGLLQMHQLDGNTSALSSLTREIDQHRERMEAQGLDLEQPTFNSEWLTSLKA